MRERSEILLVLTVVGLGAGAAARAADGGAWANGFWAATAAAASMPTAWPVAVSVWRREPGVDVVA